jgi:hypothetical protein
VVRTRTRPLQVALAIDLLILVAFVAIGRRSHNSGDDVAGFFRVLWPFVAGLAVAYAVTGLWRAPLAVTRAGAAVLVTVAVGMILRVSTSNHEFKVAFTIVTLVFLGAGMLGWRAIAQARRSRASRIAGGS